MNCGCLYDMFKNSLLTRIISGHNETVAHDAMFGKVLFFAKLRTT